MKVANNSYGVDGNYLKVLRGRRSLHVTHR